MFDCRIHVPAEAITVHNLRQKPIWALLIIFSAVVAVQAQDYKKPKVKAITAFVRIDRAIYPQQIAEALTVLRAAKNEFAKEGYEVDTIRIVTQPFAELVSGLPEAQAHSFLKLFDDLSAKEDFIPCVGPGMMRDTDGPR